jgi:hypothetical protein
MTEEEAKKKECKRVPVIAVYGPDAGNYVDYTVYCSASACMMWRWNTPTPHIAQDELGKNYEDKTGFCGLAGKP